MPDGICDNWMILRILSISCFFLSCFFLLLFYLPSYFLSLFPLYSSFFVTSSLPFPLLFPLPIVALPQSPSPPLDILPQNPRSKQSSAAVAVVVVVATIQRKKKKGTARDRLFTPSPLLQSCYNRSKSIHYQ